jgi:hypothetical protein
MADKEYDNRNSGAIFANERKEKPTHPDMRGEATIVSPSGEVFEVWVSAWGKTSKSGKDFISLGFQHKEERSGSGGGGNAISRMIKPQAVVRDGAGAASKTSGRVPELDDEVPF